MAISKYNIAKAPLSRSIYCDGLKIGAVFGSKAAAFQAASVAASFAVQDCSGFHINVPDELGSDEIPREWIAAVKHDIAS